jgi:hypothetical protein
MDHIVRRITQKKKQKPNDNHYQGVITSVFSSQLEYYHVILRSDQDAQSQLHCPKFRMQSAGIPTSTHVTHLSFKF